MWFWRKQPMLKGYISDLDLLRLRDFEQSPEARSANALAEKKKYDVIMLLRDNAQAEQVSKQIWEDL